MTDFALPGIVNEHVVEIPVIDTEDLELSMQMLDTRTDIAIMHCKVKNWSIRKYKGMIDIWVEVLHVLKNKGIDKLVVIVPEKDDKNQRFAEMFGFEAQGRMMNNETLEEFIIYDMETEIDGNC